jgi:hypothetical protein
MIGSILTSGGSIDVPYLQSRLKTITARKNADEASAREAEALTDQLDLLRSQLDRVNHLLAANEEAMAQLEQTSAQLALVDTDGKFAATDVETAMGYLSELAEGAAAYDTKPTVQTKG